MRLLIFSTILSFAGAVAAQSLIKGRIVDESGNGLPFATLYLEGTTIGTTTNANGVFALKIPPGRHQLVVQFVGYQKVREPFEIGTGETKNLTFQLRPETVQLDAIVVNSDKEDPAYRVIKNAIALRKFHLNEVKAYQCDVYIKGVQTLTEKPDKFMGMEIDIDTGIVYLSESISHFKYEKPEKVDETMISSKVSGSNNAFSWNQASDLMIDFYENKFEYEGLSERGFVSPIAGNAMLFYEYEHQGVFYEDSLMVNKIRVIPKRNTDPVFSGTIYIVEDTWRIHSTELFLTKSRGIEFVDSIKFAQVHAPIEHGIHMPITQDLSFNFKLLGFAGNGNFLSVYTNYEIEPDPQTFKAYNRHEEIFGRKDTVTVDLFEKDDFDNTIMTVRDDANSRDSMYWVEVRPIPLSPLEIKDYAVKDSIREIKESEPYRDSVDREKNKLDFGDIALTGYTWRNSFTGNYFSFPSLLQTINYNTVEGFAPIFKMSWDKRDPDKSNQFLYDLTATVRYGFGNNRLQGKLKHGRLLNNRKRQYLSVEAGRYVYQFNEREPISPLNNAYFTLAEGRNFMKIYEKSFVEVLYRQELGPGLALQSDVSLENRNQLFNNTNFTFNEDNQARLTSNIPANLEKMTTGFEQHQALKVEVGFSYRPGQKYIDRPDMRISLGSKYPRFQIAYIRAIPILAADIDYDHVKFMIDDEIRLGLLGTFSYATIAGTFLSTNRMEFMDYRHFNGNLTYVGDFQTENFQTLDYYLYSTNERYVELHAEHHFNEFILNKIPLIRKLNWQTLLATHYLHTPATGNYAEFGVGIEHIFKVLRVDYYRGYRNGELSNVGIRVGAGF